VGRFWSIWKEKPYQQSPFYRNALIRNEDCFFIYTERSTVQLVEAFNSCGVDFIDEIVGGF
jgi:hypothetical protein